MKRFVYLFLSCILYFAEQIGKVCYTFLAKHFLYRKVFWNNILTKYIKFLKFLFHEHHKVYHRIIDQTNLQIFREVANKVFCQKMEHFTNLSMPNKSMHWKESPLGTSRIIFSQYIGVTPAVPTTRFCIYVIVWWEYETTGKR